MSLPISIFATPGVRAEGDGGLVPPGVEQCGGLQIAYVARTATMCNVRPPCFGWLTNKLRHKGGGGDDTSPYFLIAILHVPDRPDVLLTLGRWCYAKPALSIYYPTYFRILAADPKVSKVTYKEMADTDYILDFNWGQLAGFQSFEPLARVIAGGSAHGSATADFTLGACLVPLPLACACSRLLPLARARVLIPTADAHKPPSRVHRPRLRPARGGAASP